MPKRDNPYLMIINPDTREDYAVTPEGFEAAGYADRGFRVDKYQDGRKYEGGLPKVTPAQREKLGLAEPTPEKDTVEAVQARQAERDQAAATRAAERASRAEARRAGTNTGAAEAETPTGSMER